jgi:hypothetical protein
MRATSCHRRQRDIEFTRFAYTHAEFLLLVGGKAIGFPELKRHPYHNSQGRFSMGSRPDSEIDEESTRDRLSGRWANIEIASRLTRFHFTARWRADELEPARRRQGGNLRRCRFNAG